MAKKPQRKKKQKSGWSERMKISPEESLERMRTFPQRKEAFIAAVRKGKNRSVSA